MKGLWARFSILSLTVELVSLICIIIIFRSLCDNCTKVSLSYTYIHTSHSLDCWWCMTLFYIYAKFHLHYTSRKWDKTRLLFWSFTTFQGFWWVNKIWCIWQGWYISIKCVKSMHMYSTVFHHKPFALDHQIKQRYHQTNCRFFCLPNFIVHMC